MNKKILTSIFLVLSQSAYAEVLPAEAENVSCESFANDFSCEISIAGTQFIALPNETCSQGVSLSCAEISEVDKNFDITSKQATFTKNEPTLNDANGICSYTISGTCVGPCGNLSDAEQQKIGQVCTQPHDANCTAEEGIYFCNQKTNTVDCSAPKPECPADQVQLDPCDSDVVINSLKKSLESSRWNYNGGVYSRDNAKVVNFDHNNQNYKAIYSTWKDTDGLTERSTTFGCVRNPNVSGIDASTDAAITIDNINFSEIGGTSGSNNLDNLKTIVNSYMPKNSKACYVCAALRGDGCFDPQVQITLADGSAKAAGEIQVGDALFNPVTREAVSVSRVIEGPEKVSMVLFKYADGELKVSQEHPMLTANGLKQAKDVKAGEKLFNGDNSEIVVESAELIPVEEGQWVVNFILEGADMSKSENRMLLADGVITGDLQTQIELKITK